MYTLCKRVTKTVEVSLETHNNYCFYMRFKDIESGIEEIRKVTGMKAKQLLYGQVLPYSLLKSTKIKNGKRVKFIIPDQERSDVISAINEIKGLRNCRQV